MPKLTKRVVDAIQPDPARRLFIFDDDLSGFGLSVTTSGVKSYFVQYRPGAGRRKMPKRRVTIGRHGSPWTVDAARAEARRLLALVAGGADPASEKAEARKGPGADQTFAAVARRFLDRQRTEIRPKTGRPLRAKTLADYRGIVEGKLIPVWGERDVASITRRDVARVVDAVADTAPVMARLTFAVAWVLFGWCVERHVIQGNPCLATG